MDKKKTAFILLTLILILSWVVNLSYFYVHQLREPVFLKQYISGRFYPKQNLEFDFYYITNRNEDLDVVSVEIPQLNPFSPNLKTFQYNTYGSHVLKFARVTIDTPFFDLIPAAGLRINKLRVHYRNGLSQEVSIGEFAFEPAPVSDLASPQEQPALKNLSSGVSSNRTGFSSFSAEKSMTIQKVDYPWKDILGEGLRVYVKVTQDGSSAFERMRSDAKEDPLQQNLQEENYSQDQLLDKTYFPLRLEKGESLTLFYQFDPIPANTLRAYDYCRVGAQIQYQTEDGKQDQAEFSINNSPSFVEKDIRRILKERRENQ